MSVMSESKLKCVGISDIHGLLPADLPLRQLEGEDRRPLLPLRAHQPQVFPVEPEDQIVPVYAVLRRSGEDIPLPTLGKEFFVFLTVTGG